MFKILSDEEICRECARQLGGNPCDPNVSRLDCSLYPQMEAYLKGAQAQARENARELIAKFQQLNSGNAITGYIAVITPEEYEALRP